MQKRKIIRINEEKCSGCGKCAIACAEGAIKIINGKARLISEKYCDGLGACIGKCPEDAIMIDEREAEEFDEKAAKEHLLEIECLKHKSGACPSAAVHWEKTKEKDENILCSARVSELSNWPIKLNLVNPKASYFNNASLLVAADCSAFAYGDLHRDFIRGKIIVIGCPKFNDVIYYIEKLTEIFRHSDIKSVEVVRMEVPCCSGLTFAVESALKASGMSIPFKEHIITIKGEILANKLLFK
ncbi:MAG: ferredoxin [Candidatus Altiarchaeales archaeon A3]|nr:MAG: ferredoxin [Candidatus Altiarchaeales archaeon A3]